MFSFIKNYAIWYKGKKVLKRLNRQQKQTQMKKICWHYQKGILNVEKSLLQKYINT